MFRPVAVAVMVAIGSAVSLAGATLEYLSMHDMIARSTAIIRATVAGMSTEIRGPSDRPMIYTHYALDVSEALKGSAGARADVAVPGGEAHGLRQVFPGAPRLRPGEQYVFFLWTSRSGLTQIIGLSQGLFTIKTGANGKAVAARPASSEPMIGADGSFRRDQPRSIPLADLRARIANLAALKAVR